MRIKAQARSRQGEGGKVGYEKVEGTRRGRRGRRALFMLRRETCSDAGQKRRGHAANVANERGPPEPAGPTATSLLQFKSRKRCCGRRIWLARAATFGDLDSEAARRFQVLCTWSGPHQRQLRRRTGPGRLFLDLVKSVRARWAEIRAPVSPATAESKWGHSHPQSPRRPALCPARSTPRPSSIAPLGWPRRFPGLDLPSCSCRVCSTC